MNVACTKRGQGEAKPERQNGKKKNIHSTCASCIGARSTHRWSPRCKPHASSPLLGTLFYCEWLSVLSRGIVDRDVIERCPVQQNPGGALPRDGSSDRLGGCLELCEQRRMHHADELSIFHLNLGGWGIHVRLPTCPGTPLDPAMMWVAGGIGKAQSAQASSMVLILLLFSLRQATPLKSLPTTSTWSSSWAARKVRISFFPMSRLLVKMLKWRGWLNDFLTAGTEWHSWANAMVRRMRDCQLLGTRKKNASLPRGEISKWHRKTRTRRAQCQPKETGKIVKRVAKR